MMYRITRHAAQHIWQQALTSPAPVTGVLLMAGDCIVGGTEAVAIPTAEGQQAGGFFYMELPEAAVAMEREAMLDDLPDDGVPSTLLHVHLDFHAAGLLKMAAYTLINDRLIPVKLEMID